MKKVTPLRIIAILLSLVFLITYTFPAYAFQYQSLSIDNLIQNPWFRSANCTYSSSGWNTNSGEAPWGGSAKYQDPNDMNCDGDWTGFAARFARNLGSTPEFYPNKNAILYQVVGPVSTTDKTLHFHFLFVAHRFNRLKAEIYGSNNVNGPWTGVWVPFDEQNCLTKDCANAPYNQYCMQTRECLWNYVTEAYLGSLNPLTQTITQAYPYYKIEFLGNYPEPDGTATGDVGIKLARVYFKVSGESSAPTPTGTPAQSSPTPTKDPRATNTPTPTPVNILGDINGDGIVNIQDFTLLSNAFGTNNASSDINSDGIVNILDFTILSNNFGQSG